MSNQTPEPQGTQAVQSAGSRNLFDDPGQEQKSERSLRQLIWQRFTQHKLGVTGAIIIAIIVFVIIFAEFFSPYHHQTTHYQYGYAPPMITKIHFDGFRPFVYGLTKKPAFREIDGRRVPLPGVWDYGEDTSQKYYIKFFTSGDPYKLLGLIPTDIHLFGTGTPASSSGQVFLFGTDNNGRDIFSRVLFAGRVTLALAPLVILISFLVGTLIGGISGYMSGMIDTFLQRFTEIFMSLPRLALLLAMAGILTYMGRVPPMVRFWSIAGLLAIVNWAAIARVVRGQFLALRESEYTQAARAVGSSNMRIITRHIMPNITSYLVVAATLSVPDIIILESILSFLGHGIQHPLISWGSMLQNFASNASFELQFHPWLMIPAAFIVLTVLAFNFLGDALRDAVDPYSVVSGEGDE